jgi:T5SS/PEP-CTERM-associated repeat protein
MKTTTPWILLASSLLYPPTAHAEVTLTFREQGVEAVLHSTPLAPDRKTINGGLETDSLTASLQYSDDDIQGAQSASATITAQPTFDDDFSNLTGFFGGGSVTAIAPTGAYRSVAEASFRLYFVTDQPVNFNLDFTALSPASYYDLYENIPNFSLNLGTGVKYDVRADDPSVHFAGTNGGGNFSQVIEPGQVGVELDFIASALDDEMPTASFDFFFLASIAPVGPTGLKWDEPAGGDFHTAGNWLGDTLPAVDEDILFDLPNTYAVTLDEDAQVGDMEIAQGQVSLDYGSRRVEINDLTIKGASGQTTLYVGSNAGVNTAEHGLIGHAFTIGANGRLTNLSTGQFYVGYVDIPENDPNSDQTKTDLQARKSVRVEDGGELITPNVRVDGPANAGGSGVATVAVDGAGSTWRARRLDIGGTYTGRVEVTKGGRLISVDVGAEALGVNVESPSDSTQSVIRVAGEAGSGERSTLLAANMTLGVDHRGRLEVVDGAGAGVDILRLGIRPMSHGTALIRGAGTTFGSGNGGFALIKAGDGGFGQLDIEAGAFVEANVTIGDGSIFALGDNRGIVNLSGEYTQLNSPNLNVGLRSAAELNISSGAKVSTSIAHFARYFNSTATVNIATSDGVSIPEPTTLALIALGGLVAFRRQRCIEALRRS